MVTSATPRGASVASSSASPDQKGPESSSGAASSSEQRCAEASGLTPSKQADASSHHPSPDGDVTSPSAEGLDGEGGRAAAEAEAAREEQRAVLEATAAVAAERKAKQEMTIERMVARRREESLQRLSLATAELKSLEEQNQQSSQLLATREASYEEYCRAKQAALAAVDEQRAAIDADITRIESVQAALATTNLDDVDESIVELEGTLEVCDSLDHVWKTTLREDSVQAVLPEELVPQEVAAFMSRVSHCTFRYEVAVQNVEERLLKQDQSIKRAAELKTAVVRRLRHARHAEEKALEERRRQLKIHEGEQRFHERRGTFVKERNPHPHADELKKDQERDRHTQLCASVLRSEEDVKLVLGQVQGLRKDIENEKKEYEEREQMLKRQLRDLAASATAASNSRTALEKESADLKALRSELAALFQIVRQRNRQ
jgi:hypothetical protein